MQLQQLMLSAVFILTEILRYLSHLSYTTLQSLLMMPHSSSSYNLTLSLFSSLATLFTLSTFNWPITYKKTDLYGQGVIE